MEREGRRGSGLLGHVIDEQMGRFLLAGSVTKFYVSICIFFTECYYGIT